MSTKRYKMFTPVNLSYRTMGVRSNESGVSGYASHFGSVDSYGTAIQRGAFAETLTRRGDRIPVLWNHDTDSPIGKPRVLKEDSVGLYFDAKITESTPDGKRIMELLRDGVPLGMSFGFEVLSQRPATDTDVLDFSVAPRRFKDSAGRKEVRVIEEVELWEISIVTFPANSFATINDVRKSRNRYAEYQALQAAYIIDLADSQRPSQRELLMDELLGRAS